MDRNFTFLNSSNIFLLRNDYTLNFSVFTGIFLFILFSVNNLQAQSSDKIIDRFSARNEKLSDVIIRLSSQSGLNFSYNANDPTMDIKITYTAENKTITQILDDILPSALQTYKQIGNQIVVYKLQKKKNNTPPSGFSPVQKKVRTEKIFFDTIVLYDTLLQHDTLVQHQYDTVRVVDTVFVTKEKQHPRKTTNFPVDYFQQNESREKGLSGELFYAPLLTNFSFTGEKNPVSIKSFMLGTGISLLKKSWDFTFGFRLMHFANRFTATQTNTKGGFFLQDTVDSYYTLTAGDTSWYYVIDSTWKPLQTYLSDIDRINRIGYLNVGGSVAFTYYSTKAMRWYARLGVQMSIPIYATGLAYKNNDETQFVDFKTLKFEVPLYSVLLGSGLKYRLNRSLDIRSEIFYLNYFQPMVREISFGNIPDALGIKIGLIYYFR